MARSRSGGTSGLLSGKLGDVIYSITRNADGSFRQQVSANPEYRENPNTDAQARARCTMATIERAMFTFRDFMGTGFEGIDKGTNSVSKFSEINYNNIKEQIEFWWDDPENWDDQFNLPKKGQQQPRGGCYILAQGSLRIHSLWMLGWGGLNNPYFYFRTNQTGANVSLKDWLAVNGMLIGDQRVKVVFMEGTTPSKSAVVYVIVATSLSANPNTVISRSNFRNLLTLSSNIPLNVTFDDATGRMTFEFTRGADYGFRCASMDADRLRRLKNGKLLYSNCELTTLGGYDPSDYGWQTLSQVKNSWLNSI